jgi:hypothetical protein
VIRYGLKVELFRGVSQSDLTVMCLRSRRQNPRGKQELAPPPRINKAALLSLGRKWS